MHTTNVCGNNRLLIIDDEPSIHEQMRAIFDGSAGTDERELSSGEIDPGSSAIEFEVDSAFSGEEGLLKVQEAANAGRPYAIAFLDERIQPGWDGVETLSRIWKLHPNLQVVICTGDGHFNWGQMIEKVGKAEGLAILKKPFEKTEALQLARLLKFNRELGCQLQHLDNLIDQRTSELQAANDILVAEITERMEAEKALRISEERFSKAFRASPIPLAIQSLHGETFVDANDGFLELTGYTWDELIGRRPEELHLFGEAVPSRRVVDREEPRVRNVPSKLRSKSNQVREILLSMELLELEAEPLFLTIAQDITEQLRLESQLRQSQKLEAIGQLAAGVAHDFNNILTVIQGHAALMLKNKREASPERKPLQTISAASERAGKLVRQLLTFSRKQFMQPTPIKVAEAFGMVSDMLPRLLGEHLTVRIAAAPDLPRINADPGMMEQMLINLAVNARDAMKKGGRLTITAKLAEVTVESARNNHEARPGQFICVSVSDTGSGITPEVLPRIFEPFFTTKPVGKGTGLGLATVYGIAKQHHGWVEVQTQVGQGTTFLIFLPVLEKEAEACEGDPEERQVRGGSETILVVEDEDPVREFIVQVLKGEGYDVLAASSGAEALERWHGRTRKINLLLTDMVMPGGLLGRELAELLVGEDRELAVIYTSGFTPGTTGEDVALFERPNFLPKPYGPEKLLKMVRTSLDQGGRVHSALPAEELPRELLRV